MKNKIKRKKKRRKEKTKEWAKSPSPERRSLEINYDVFIFIWLHWGDGSMYMFNSKLVVDVLLTSDRRTRNLFRRGRFGVSSRVHGVAMYTPMTAYPAALWDNLSGNSGHYGAYNHPLTSGSSKPSKCRAPPIVTPPPCTHALQGKPTMQIVSIYRKRQWMRLLYSLRYRQVRCTPRH